MQSSIILKIMTRTKSEQISALQKVIGDIDKLLPKMDPSFTNFEKRVAHLALLEHVKRVEHAIENMLEPEQKSPEASFAPQKALQHLNENLKLVKEKINNSLIKIPKPDAIEAKTSQPSILIAGAGPIGLFAGMYLLLQQKHQLPVKIIADHHALLPVKNGSIDENAIYYCLNLLGLMTRNNQPEQRHIRQQLLTFITLRRQPFYSLKHMDLLSTVCYLALGGDIVNGTFDWKDIQKIEGTPFPSVSITPLQKGGKKIEITAVRCVIHAMGIGNNYPPQITRQPVVLDDKSEQIMRTHGIQINITVPFQYAVKLSKLDDCLLKQTNQTCKMFQLLDKTKINTKIQIYLFLTENENELLNNVLDQQFSEFLNQHRDDREKDIRLILKTLLYIDFLSTKVGIDLKIEESIDIIIRDQIKKGKPLCSEFKLPQPTIPPQEVFSLAGTDGVTTWIGAAALPPVINGLFMPYAVKHTTDVLKGLIINGFKPGKLDVICKEAVNTYQAWIERVFKSIKTLNQQHQELSEALEKHFSNKCGTNNKKTPIRILGKFAVNVIKVEQTHTVGRKEYKV